MRLIDCGSLVTVTVSRDEVETFKSQWPCSGLPNKAVWFQFEKRNGDLVDIKPGFERYDGDALLALSHDAGNYAAKRLNLPDMAR